MKTCSKCGEIKELSEFNNSKATKDGKLAYCKICHRKRAREYELSNQNKTKSAKSRRYFLNIEREREKRKSWWVNNKSTLIEKQTKRRRELHPEYVAKALRIPISQLTPELIELKREQLLMHRATKRLIEEIENGTK